MRLLYIALLFLLCTCARAQTCQVLGTENFQGYTPAQLMAAKSNTDTLQPWVYAEIDYDYVSAFPSPAEAESTFRAAFAEVVKRYEVDATIQPRLDLFVHTQPSGYVATNATSALYEFNDRVGDHPADVKLLVSFRGSGGAAFLGRTCKSFGVAYASVHPEFAPYDVYSWTVLVIGHELGHVFGANHTQACVWNGNNTPLDGCFTPEGDCDRPELPAVGSMMSYCHLQSSVENSTRILPQVAAVMRAHLMAAGCVASKPATPTSCTDYPIALSLITDLHPRETAWMITATNGDTLAVSPPYEKAQYLTELTDSLCLPAGCYTLTITDAAGDGFFNDRYGFGSLQITSQGESLVYVEAFGRETTHEFCLGVEPEICAPIALTDFQPYGGNQDNGTGELTNDDRRLTLSGNAWKAIPKPYTITPQTILEVQVKAGPVGEIIGIGLDDNEVLSSTRTFRLGGSQAWGLGNYALYPQQGGGWMRVSIPVGQFYTGEGDRIFFVNDKDFGPTDNVATFRDVVLHEGQCGSAAPLALGAAAGAGEGSKAGFYFDVASPWSLTDLATGRLLLRGQAGAGASVYLDEVNAPLGVYVFSWMTGEGPAAEKLLVGPQLR